jgi:hypothetical protein
MLNSAIRGYQNLLFGIFRFFSHKMDFQFKKTGELNSIEKADLGYKPGVFNQIF